MANIKFNTDKSKQYIEAGDAIQTKDGDLLFVFHVAAVREGNRAIEEHWGYVNMNNGESVSGFSHLTHVHHHLKKHYGDYMLHKGDKITVTVD